MIARRGLIFGLMASSLALIARDAWGADLSPTDQALVDEATRYLEDLTTAEGRFIQTDGAGRQESGVFWLQRPGRARFDYDPPSGLSMASDGRLVSVVNHRLKTIHNYPLGFTPLSIFLSRDIRFDRQVVVEKVDASEADFAMDLVDKRGGAHGHIRLDFRRSPLALAGWKLTDARGQSINVRLASLERSAPKPKSFFDIDEPSLHGPRTDDVAPLK